MMVGCFRLVFFVVFLSKAVVTSIIIHIVCTQGLFSAAFQVALFHSVVTECQLGLIYSRNISCVAACVCKY